MARGAESVNVNNNKCASIEAWLKAIVGNLSEEISESDLFELFGLRTTNDLCDNSDVQITLSENTGKKEALIM